MNNTFRVTERITEAVNLRIIIIAFNMKAADIADIIAALLFFRSMAIVSGSVTEIFSVILMVSPGTGGKPFSL